MLNKCLSCALIVLTLCLVATAPAAAEAKNVILMISDGLGMNGWEASSYYLYDQTNPQWHANLPYGTQKGFEMYGCTHYMLNPDGTPQGYDPAQMWSDFNYAKGDDDYLAFTDSAAAATAMYTGTKTYKGAVGVDFNKNPLESIAETASALGKSTGAVSSVQLSHATPAAVFAHNEARGNYADIANEMIYDSGADVIMGCGIGHSSEKYLGGPATLADIQDADGANGFTYVNDVADFQALADGSMTPPSKVLGVADTTYTLLNEYAPGQNPETKVPTLETMTKGALNVLSQNPDGFFMMVEGGAVDWENHGNNLGTMLEEQRDFDNSVQAVMDWVDTNSDWSETLLIVTSDHETGMIWGDGTWTDNGNGQYDEGEPFDDLNTNGVFEPELGETYTDLPDGYYDPAVDTFNSFNNVVNNGKGVMPGAIYSSGGHTNQLVPLFVKGDCAGGFEGLVDMNDATAGSFWGFDGDVVDNTDIHTVMYDCIPEPATMSLLALGGLALIRRKR